MKTRLILTTLLLIVLVSCAPVRVHEVEEQQFVYYLPIIYNNHETLESAFGKHGIRFGFSVSSRSFENPTTRAIIAEHAAIVTTEVALKMEYTQPQRNHYTFDEADAIAAYADELGIGVHGHTASWSMQNPAWLVDGTFEKYELATILRDHVTILAHHYDGRLISLDTANEAYSGRGGSLLCGPWCPLGEDYVDISFSIDPGCPVVYNSNFWNTQDPEHAIDLLNSGLADGIGIQLHLSSDGWQRRLERMDAFLDDIRQHGGFARLSEVGVLASSDQEQAEIYAAVAMLAIRHSDIVRDVVIWGVRDPAWRGNVTLFDRYGNPKPSYYTMMEELGK